jgi:hypothetical protein
MDVCRYVCVQVCMCTRMLGYRCACVHIYICTGMRVCVSYVVSVKEAIALQAPGG